MPGLTVEVLPPGDDQRGHSFSVSPEALAFLGEIRDVHLTTLVPGGIRGNHYHQRRREALLVLHSSDWELLWDEGEGTATCMRRFPGGGAELVSIHPGCAHAVRNCGTAEMLVFGMSSGAYDPEETVGRKLC
jgi:dTDP-4-dehydrorhamnose 3,5-epimerase-like enzyme